MTLQKACEGVHGCVRVVVACTCWLRTMCTPCGLISCVNSPRKVRMSSMLAVYGNPLSLRQSLIVPGGGRRDTAGSIDTKGAGATGIRGAEEYRFNT